MVILFIFLLGIGNFALHKAVLESRHPILAALPAVLRGKGGRGSLGMEFAILVLVLLLVANGHSGWGWAYLFYSAFNALAAWLILTQRI